MSERKVFSTRLDRELIIFLKHIAVELERPLNDLLEEGIRDLIKKYKKKVSWGKEEIEK